MAFPTNYWLPQCLGNNQFPELVNWCTKKAHAASPMCYDGQDLPVRNLLEHLHSQDLTHEFLGDLRDRTMREILTRLNIIVDEFQDAGEDDQIDHNEALLAVLAWRRLAHRAHAEVTWLLAELSSPGPVRSRPDWTMDEAAAEAMRFRVAALGNMCKHWKTVARVMCRLISKLLQGHAVEVGWDVIHEQIHSWHDPRVSERYCY